MDILCECGKEAVEHDTDNFPCKWTEADVLRQHLRGLEIMVDRISEINSQYVFLARPIRDLCYEIEKLPAGEQQTKVSIMASGIFQKIWALTRGGNHD